jgi:hypothetical protein
MTTHDDEIHTNAEYEPVESLDEILDKDGEPLDPIEQNQSEESYENDEGSRGQLERAITGDDENKNNE